MVPLIQYQQADFAAAVAAVRDHLRGGGLTGGGAGTVDVPAAVRDILAAVRTRGDQALIEFEAKFDKATLTAGVGLPFRKSPASEAPGVTSPQSHRRVQEPRSLRVSAEEIQNAHAQAEPAFLSLVRRVAANIREYQQSILHKNPPALVRCGRTLGVRYTPVDRVGVYVPGGRALYPSTVLMTVVPAQVAGVGQIAIASPPTTEGDINPMVLALAGELGIAEVYRVGGAVAIGALAYGTASVPRVDKIVGPGNAFVAEAKRQVLGTVGIDSIAGPSEVLIIADGSAPYAYVAADMLAQAEHDPGSAVLVTTSAALAQAVQGELANQLKQLSRAGAIRAALEQYSAIIVVNDLAAACAIANDFATEHMQIMTADNDKALSMVRHAGAIFLGPHTPVPLGDYYAGPSHVLPTGSTARFFSALSANDFLKASSVLAYDAAGLAADAADVIDFATREGLTAHAAAVKIRNAEVTEVTEEDKT